MEIINKSGELKNYKQVELDYYSAYLLFTNRPNLSLYKPSFLGLKTIAQLSRLAFSTFDSLNRVRTTDIVKAQRTNLPEGIVCKSSYERLSSYLVDTMANQRMLELIYISPTVIPRRYGAQIREIAVFNTKDLHRLNKDIRSVNSDFFGSKGPTILRHRVPRFVNQFNQHEFKTDGGIELGNCSEIVVPRYEGSQSDLKSLLKTRVDNNVVEQELYSINYNR